MYDLDLEQLNRSLVKSIGMAGATRRLIGKGRDGYEEVLDFEREVRAAAAECQRVLRLIKEDTDRPLISG